MIRTIAAILALGLISGCANGVSGLRPLTYAEPGETRTLVSFANCQRYNETGQQFAPITSALLLGAASKALENFGNALSNAATGGQLPASTASTNFETLAGTSPKCIMIARGDFAKEAETNVGRIDGTWEVRDPNDPTKTIGVEMPRIRNLQHYIELQLLVSADQSAMAIAPVYTKIEKSADGETKSNKSRDLSIALAFARPGQKDVGSVVVLTDRKIGSAETYIPSNGRFTHESPWFSAFSVPAKQGEKVSTKPIPVTAKTTLIETRPSREFLAFIASVFTGSVKPAIENELKNEFDPSTIEKNTKADFDSSAAYATTYAAAVSAVLEYCAITDTTDTKKGERATKSAAARSAQIKANKAAFEADLATPFANEALIAVSTGVPSSVNASGCALF